MPLLVEHFARRFAEAPTTAASGSPPEALSCSQTLPWKGNVRELRNLVERLLILAPGERSSGRTSVGAAAGNARVELGQRSGPRPCANSATGGEALPGAKLEEHDWNVTQTAAAIDTPRSNLYKKMEQYEIRRGESRRARRRPGEAMTSERPARRRSTACGALRRGHFLLSSGLHSPAYVQCALLLEEPRRARRPGAAMGRRLLRDLEPDSVLAPALGGVIIGHEVASALGVPFRFVERAGRILRSAARFRPCGRRACGRGRGRGDDRQVDARDRRGRRGRRRARRRFRRRSRPQRRQAGFPVPLRGASATRPADLPAADCPLCPDGSRAVKPGSRPPAARRSRARAGAARDG